jgi:hypothetical protein
MTGITIATAVGGVATKQCRLTSEGPVWIDYPLEKWWRFREVATPSDADGWAAFLEGRVNDIASCCLYGQPINAIAGRQRRLLHASEGDPATLREVASELLVLDFDSVPTPAGVDFLKDPTTAVGAIVDGIEDLTGCAFAVAISCRAGFKAGVRAKAIIQLHDAMLPSEMRRWAKAVNARTGMKLLDPGVLAPAQPIYLAKPILCGVYDPFPHRVYLRHGREPIAIVIPPETTDQTADAKVRRLEGFPNLEDATAASCGGGWRVHLSRIGQLGFHDPLLAAAGAVVHSYCSVPVEPIASAIHAIVQQAVFCADPGARGPEEIARYASRRFWDDAIAHAAGRDGDRIRRIAASVAGIRRS